MLAAGAGTRLRPLTHLRPKALCPVGGRPLVDHALDRVMPVTTAVAVNVHHGRRRLVKHLEATAPDVHVSLEASRPLGTAGALGLLRPWIDGRAALVTNADAWLPADLVPFVESWDGERVRLLCVPVDGPGDFDGLLYCGAALHPWDSVAPISPEPAGLYEVSWRERWATGRLDLSVHEGPFVDCGTPPDYLAANLALSGGGSVVGAGALVADGAVLERSVVWDGSTVASGEHLVDAIRAGPLTVLVRSGAS